MGLPRLRDIWRAAVLMTLLTNAVAKEDEAMRQITFAPWTGTANPWTGTANPWTGTANPYTGPAHHETESTRKPRVTRKPPHKSTPRPGIPGEHCYFFTCQGYYDECYRIHGAADVCARKNRYCKVSVYQSRNGSISVKANCVRRNCELTQGPGVTYGCCDSHLCNNEHLLTFDHSSALPVTAAASSVPLLTLLALVWS